MFHLFLLYCYYYSDMHGTVMPVSAYMALAFVFGFIQINWWWWGLIITVVDTLAESHSTVSASPGGAAEHAAARKTSKYSSLPASHMFRPLALETLRPINSSGISILVELGRRLTDVQETHGKPCIYFNEFLCRSSATIRQPSKEPSQFLPNWTSGTPLQLTWF